MKGYILLYNLFEDCGMTTTEPIVMSMDREKIIKYKTELEAKSWVLQGKIEDLLQKRQNKLNPLIKDLDFQKRSLKFIFDEEEKQKVLGLIRDIRESMGKAYNEYSTELEKFKNEMNVKYFISDPDIENLEIVELEVLE